MNKLETNALRIAELMGYKKNIIDGTYSFANQWSFESEILRKFSSYQGLMPLVFECNTGFNTLAIRIHENRVQLLRNNKDVEFDHGDGGIYYDSQDDEPLEFLFIEKIQLAVIKYLELRNES